MPTTGGLTAARLLLAVAAAQAVPQSPPPALEPLTKREVAAIHAAALRETLRTEAVRSEAVSKVFLSVDEGQDPYPELLALLPDLAGVVRPRSECIKRKTVVGELCQVATGEVQIWLGPVARVGADLAELTVGVHTLSCRRRVRRERDVWRVLGPMEFAGLCRVA